MNQHNPANKDCPRNILENQGEPPFDRDWYCTCPPATDEVEQIRERCKNYARDYKALSANLPTFRRHGYDDCKTLLRIIDQQAAEIARWKQTMQEAIKQGGQLTADLAAANTEKDKLYNEQQYATGSAARRSIELQIIGHLLTITQEDIDAGEVFTSTDYDYTTPLTDSVYQHRKDFLKLRADLAAAQAEIERLRAGIHAFLDGDAPPEIPPNTRCKHGYLAHEDCVACEEQYFLDLLAGRIK